MATSSNASPAKPAAVSVATQPEKAGASRPEPRLWLLLGDRHGDNAQLHALAATLADLFGWQSLVKQLHYDLDCATPHRDRGRSLIGLSPSSRSELQAPWPDIVIAASKSAASVCRWIRKQSGDRTIIVLLGRPRVAYRHFDLIVATPQFGMPEADNIIKCCLPMTWQDENQLTDQARLWEQRWQNLPRPWTAVMVGGSTAQMHFDAEAARSLVGRLARYQLQVGGSLLVTTSPRTPVEVTELISQHLQQPHYLFAWQPNVPNPLQAMLALADVFVVTVDSVSMLAEAANRMKPVYYFSLPRQDPEHHPSKASWSQRLRRRRQNRHDCGLSPDLLDRLADCLAVTGYLRPRNNYTSLETILQRNDIAAAFDPASQFKLAPMTNFVRREREHVAAEVMARWIKASGAKISAS